MLEIAAEPIESPAHDHIHLAAAGILQQRVQRRAAVFGHTDTMVNVLNSLPVSGFAIAGRVQPVG